MSQTKRDRFLRLASTRIDKALVAIGRLGNCGNRATYEYTDADVERMFTALRKAVEAAETKFRVGAKNDARAPFQF